MFSDRFHPSSNAARTDPWPEIVRADADVRQDYIRRMLCLSLKTAGDTVGVSSPEDFEAATGDGSCTPTRIRRVMK